MVRATEMGMMGKIGAILGRCAAWLLEPERMSVLGILLAILRLQNVINIDLEMLQLAWKP